MLNLACNRVERFNFGTDLHLLIFTKINDYAVLGLSAPAQSLLMLVECCTCDDGNYEQTFDKLISF